MGQRAATGSFSAHGGDVGRLASAQQCQGDVRDTVVHGGEVQGVGASFAASVRAVEHLEGNGVGGGVGPRRVLAGKGRRAVRNDERGGATWSGYSGLARPANGFTGAVQCGVHPDMVRARARLTPATASGVLGCLAGQCGYRQGSRSGHDPTFLALPSFPYFPIFGPFGLNLFEQANEVLAAM